MLIIEYKITIGDLIQIAAILIAAFGLFLNLIQLRTGNRQKRAEYILNLYNQYISDDKMLEIYYKIEYQEFEYCNDFHRSEDERKLDKLLHFYDNIAKLHQLKNLTLEDLDYIAYNYLVIYQNSEIQKYLKFLDGWFKDRGLSQKPFSAFQVVGHLLEKKYYVSNGSKNPKRSKHTL